MGNWAVVGCETMTTSRQRLETLTTGDSTLATGFPEGRSGRTQARTPSCAHGDDRDASSRCRVSLVQGARALTSKDGRREIFAARDMQM